MSTNPRPNPVMTKRLTAKQRRFVEEFMKNKGNATRAALKAYDCNYNAARSIGCENLTKPYIQAILGSAIVPLLERALVVMNDGMKANKKIIKQNEGQVQVIDTGEPDWNVRDSSARNVLGMVNIIMKDKQAGDSRQETSKEPIIDIIPETEEEEWALRYIYDHKGLLPDDEQLAEYIENEKAAGRPSRW